MVRVGDDIVCGCFTDVTVWMLIFAVINLGCVKVWMLKFVVAERQRCMDVDLCCYILRRCGL